MKIAFDTQLMKPGCVLIQAVLGGSPGVLRGFPAECWLAAATPGMALYEVTAEQLAILVNKTRSKVTA